MKMIQKAFVAGAFFVMFAGAESANAASLYIDPAFPKLQMGDAVTLSVRLDTNEAEEECINAVDGVVSYSENLSPVDVSVGDSIFSVWVEQPKIDKEKRTITFAGGIPNGYCGRVPGDPRLTNTVVKLIFRSPGFTIGSGSGTSTAKVEFLPETTAYLNDGFGTKAELAMFGSSIELGDTPGAELVDPWREAVVTDNVPPEEFSIDLVQEDKTFGGKYFLVFNTTDKQTGIDQYQVMEEAVADRFAFNWGRADAPWVTARSPYVLEDQSLNSTIYVKAIDKAGNEYIATLLPEQAMSSTPLSNILLYSVLGFLVFVIIVAGSLIARRLWKRRSTDSVAVAKNEEDSKDNN
jgi:hypothetical protein